MYFNNNFYKMDLNRTTIIWNVSKDVEMKQTQSWMKVCSFSIATSRSWKNDSWEKHEESEFHNVVLWGKLAELAEQFCKKWARIYFEGRLKTNSWEDSEWKKKYRTEIIGENFILLDKKQAKKNEFWDEEITIEDIPF